MVRRLFCLRLVVVLSEFLDRFGVVCHIDIQPHQPGNAENIHKIDRQKQNEYAERLIDAPVEPPFKNGDGQQRKPAGPDIGNEHGAVIVPRLGEIIEVALRATLQHFEWLHERPAAGFERSAFLTARAFQVKNAVGFGRFFKNIRHGLVEVGNPERVHVAKVRLTAK